MENPITIRQATLVDVNEIVGLNYGLFMDDAALWDSLANLDWAIEYGEIYFAAALEDDHYICFLAESGGTPVGYLIGSIMEPFTIRPVRVAELESMFVLEGYRGQGVGARLVELFKEWAASQGAKRLRVTAYAENAKALAFYRRAGFKPYKLTLEMGLNPSV